MVVFWGASGFLLAIVCANVASLLLARNLASQREIAIRAALGASSMGIVRMLLVESLVLGIAGGLGGVLVGTWGTAALLALRPLSLSLVYPSSVAVDATVIGYSLALAIVTGVLVGAAPALRAARADLLRGVGRDDPYVRTSASGRWVFGGAVALQAALAVVLLVGALLMVTSYLRLQRVGPGFVADNVAEMAIQLDPSAYADAGTRRQLFAQVAERIRALGGVVDASLATDAPPHSTMMMAAVEIEGRPSDAPPTIEASWVHVSATYFRVLRIPQLEGRTLSDGDASQGSVIVSQSLARRFWPGESAVGRQFRLRREAGWGPWMHVVGVVGDVTGRGLRDAYDEIYLPFAAGRAERGTILARVDGEPSRLFQAMKEQLWAIDPDVPVAGIVTVRERLARSIDEQPFYATLLGVFAGIAMALAAAGVFGVAAYAASQRTREIGIRVAIGAQTGDVARLVALQGLVPALVGIVAGLAGAYALAQTMQAMTSTIHGLSATDPTTYVSTALTLAVLSSIATWLPARRASRVDPMIVLRNE
jgi:predicted permease